MPPDDRVLITLQEGRQVDLDGIAEFDDYLVHSEPDGTLVWEPADVITVTEHQLSQDEVLLARVAANRLDPSRLRHRDRRASPRA
jgi:hypothetical protein